MNRFTIVRPPNTPASEQRISVYLDQAARFQKDLHLKKAAERSDEDFHSDEDGELDKNILFKELF
jgi:hypothetical protein